MATTTKAKRQNAAPVQNAFAGQVKKPTERALASVLGDGYQLWKRLVDDLKGDLKLDVAEWHSFSPKYGWFFRIQFKKRNIVYLGPRQGGFIAAFALGDRAVARARKSELPGHILQIIAEARRYAEGTAVRVEVRNAAGLDAVKTLARIKLEN